VATALAAAACSSDDGTTTDSAADTADVVTSAADEATPTTTAPTPAATERAGSPAAPAYPADQAHRADLARHQGGRLTGSADRGDRTGPANLAGRAKLGGSATPAAAADLVVPTVLGCHPSSTVPGPPGRRDHRRAIRSPVRRVPEVPATMLRVRGRPPQGWPG
jgi:hypothetical protein